MFGIKQATPEIGAHILGFAPSAPSSCGDQDRFTSTPGLQTGLRWRAAKSTVARPCCSPLLSQALARDRASVHGSDLRSTDCVQGSHSGAPNHPKQTIHSSRQRTCCEESHFVIVFAAETSRLGGTPFLDTTISYSFEIGIFFASTKSCFSGRVILNHCLEDPDP